MNDIGDIAEAEAAITSAIRTCNMRMALCVLVAALSCLLGAWLTWIAIDDILLNRPMLGTVSIVAAYIQSRSFNDMIATITKVRAAKARLKFHRWNLRTMA